MAAKVAPKAPNKGPAPKAAPKAPALSAMQKKLAAMKKAWAEKKEESKSMGGGGINVPPDFYITKITDATLRDGDQGISGVIQFTVIEGDQTGETIPLWLNFGSEERMVFAMRDLRRLNIDVDEVDVTDLEEVMKQLAEAALVVRVRVVEKGEYLNVYINKVMEDYEGGTDEPGAGTEEGGEGGEEAGGDAGEGGEEAGAEAGEEGGEDAGEGGEEATTEELDVGSEVTYNVKDPKTKKQVAARGLVTKIEGDTFSIKNLKTKVIDKVDKDVAGVEAAPATE